VSFARRDSSQGDRPGPLAGPYNWPDPYNPEPGIVRRSINAAWVRDYMARDRVDSRVRAVTARCQSYLAEDSPIEPLGIFASNPYNSRVDSPARSRLMIVSSFSCRSRLRSHTSAA
jgi:hypothetical protein